MYDLFFFVSVKGWRWHNIPNKWNSLKDFRNLNDAKLTNSWQQLLHFGCDVRIDALNKVTTLETSTILCSAKVANPRIDQFVWITRDICSSCQYFFYCKLILLWIFQVKINYRSASNSEKVKNWKRMVFFTLRFQKHPVKDIVLMRTHRTYNWPSHAKY